MHLIADEEVRIDKFLANKLELSRSKIQKLLKEGKILVNGKSTSANYVLKLKDEIAMEDELDFTISVTPSDDEVEVVYEDDYLLIVNKKSGMVVHPAPGNYDHTLVNALLGRFQLSNDAIRPGIVHRIDKDTSGLLIVAKTDEMHDKLSKMIAEKKIERRYLAIVDGLILHETGTIDAPIGRDLENRQKMKVTDVNAKHAVTHFKVLQRFANKTLIECKLETGRTHQIRVHMAYIGHPVYNDPVYNSKKATEFGQYLHSKSIRFIHPVTKKEIYIEQEPPIEFQEKIKELSTDLEQKH